MDEKVNSWQKIGFAATSLGGTLLHFLYDLTGKALWIAPFSGVNESTWEHMKLLYFPMLIFALIQGFFFKGYKSYWCIKLRGILLGLALIPVIFYTYNGVIGKSPDWINIAIFFVAAAVSYIYEAYQLKRNKIKCASPALAFILICIIGVFFVLFTFFPPEIGIFKDPLTGGYGI